MRVAVLCVLSLAPAATKADAEDDPRPPERFSADSLFQPGRYEASVTSGVLFSPFIANTKRPVINYSITELQLGYMLTDFKETGFFRGNFELAGEAFASDIFAGPGSYIAGGTLWGRYNFVRPGWRLVPFLQAGAGLTTTDIDHHIVGQPFNFNLNLGAGLRYFLAPRWAINLEYRYQHISNANMGRNNVGINAHGPILGVSFLF